jgi:hypothetical protein
MAMKKILGLLLIVVMCYGCTHICPKCPEPIVIKIPVPGQCPKIVVNDLPDLPIFRLASKDPASVVLAYEQSIYILMQELGYYHTILRGLNK